MASRKQTCPERIRALLQPDVVIPLNHGVAGPLDMMWLREKLAGQRGFGSDQVTGHEGSIQCMVRFKHETWGALNEMTERLRAEGSPASPSHLAALLIEAGLARLPQS